MKERHVQRNARMRELRPYSSLTEIAKELGVSVSTVAGVFFRDDHPYVPRPPREATVLELGKAARRAGLTLLDIRSIAEQRRAS